MVSALSVLDRNLHMQGARHGHKMMTTCSSVPVHVDMFATCEVLKAVRVGCRLVVVQVAGGLVAQDEDGWRTTITHDRLHAVRVMAFAKVRVVAGMHLVQKTGLVLRVTQGKAAGAGEGSSHLDRKGCARIAPSVLLGAAAGRPADLAGRGHQSGNEESGSQWAAKVDTTLLRLPRGLVRSSASSSYAAITVTLLPILLLSVLFFAACAPRPCCARPAR